MRVLQVESLMKVICVQETQACPRPEDEVADEQLVVRQRRLPRTGYPMIAFKPSVHQLARASCQPQPQFGGLRRQTRIAPVCSKVAHRRAATPQYRI